MMNTSTLPSILSASSNNIDDASYQPRRSVSSLDNYGSANNNNTGNGSIRSASSLDVRQYKQSDVPQYNNDSLLSAGGSATNNDDLEAAYHNSHHMVHPGGFSIDRALNVPLTSDADDEEMSTNMYPSYLNSWIKSNPLNTKSNSSPTSNKAKNGGSSGGINNNKRKKISSAPTPLSRSTTNPGGNLPPLRGNHDISFLTDKPGHGKEPPKKGGYLDFVVPVSLLPDSLREFHSKDQVADDEQHRLDKLRQKWIAGAMAAARQHQHHHHHKHQQHQQQQHRQYPHTTQTSPNKNSNGHGQQSSTTTNNNNSHNDGSGAEQPRTFELPPSTFKDFEGDITNYNIDALLATTDHFEGINKWHNIAFPDNRPSGRREAMLLEKWLEEALHDLTKKKFNNQIDFLKATQHTFSMCMHELVRQTAVHCIERGRLLAKVWVRYVDLFNYLTVIMAQEREASAKRQSELEKDLEWARLNYLKSLDELQKTIEQSDTTLSFFQSEIRIKDKDLEDAKKKIDQLMKLLQLSDKERNGLEENLKESKSQIRRLTEEIEMLRFKVKDLVSDNDSLKQSLTQSLASSTTPPKVVELKISVEAETQTNPVKIEIDSSDSNEEEKQEEEIVNKEDDTEGKKKKQTKKTKQRRKKPLFIPEGFKNIIKKKSFGDYQPQRYTLEYLQRHIMKLYLDKIAADEADDREHNERECMTEFIYTNYLHTFGMRDIAEKKLLDLFDSVRVYASDDRRVRLFRRFANIYEQKGAAPTTPTSSRQSHSQNQNQNKNQNQNQNQTTDTLLSPVVAAVVEEDGAITDRSTKSQGSTSSARSTPREPDGEEPYTIDMLNVFLDILKIVQARKKPASLKLERKPLDYEIWNEAVQTVFVGVPKEDRDILIARLKAAAAAAKGGGGGGAIDLDEFLMIAMEEWERISRPIFAKVEEIFAAADINGDAFMDFSEFTLITKHLSSIVQVSARQMQRLWTDTFGGTNGTVATSSSFVSMLRPHLHVSPSSVNLERTMEALNKAPEKIRAQIEKQAQEKRTRAIQRIQSAYRKYRRVAKMAATVQQQQQQQHSATATTDTDAPPHHSSAFTSYSSSTVPDEDDNNTNNSKPNVTTVG